MSELYIGSGKNIENDRERLATKEVDNEVVFVDTDINVPIDFQIGKRSSLGLFLSSKPGTISGGENLSPVEVDADHGRSGVLGRFVFNDKNGNLYRDLEIKGLGASTFGPQGPYVDVVEPSLKRTEGVLDIRVATRDYNYSKLFSALGIRIVRSIAVLRLKEIVDGEGKNIDINSARKRNILKVKDEPAILVRAFGTRSRLAELGNLFSDKEMDTGFQKLDDARKLVAQEKGVSSEGYTFCAYLRSIIRYLGSSLRTMHDNGYVHGRLLPHNLTLDGRLVDFDSVVDMSRLGEAKSKENDLRFLKDSLSSHAENMVNILSRNNSTEEVAQIKEIQADINVLIDESYSSVVTKKV